MRILVVCFATTLSLILGCGDSTGLATISGTVNYEGTLIEEGRIDFVPEDGKGPTASVPIAGGKYTAEVAPGKKIVNVLIM